MGVKTPLDMRVVSYLGLYRLMYCLGFWRKRGIWSCIAHSDVKRAHSSAVRHAKVRYVLVRKGFSNGAGKCSEAGHLPA